MISALIDTLRAGFFSHPLASFVILHVLGGRAASLVAARLAGFEMFFYLPLAIALDMLQVPFLFFLFQESGRRIGPLRALKERAESRKEALAGSRIYRRLVLLGHLGVVLMTLLPVKGGGMWSGALLAHLLQLRRLHSYLLLLVGSILGGMLLIGLSDLIRELWFRLGNG
jgi:uncharacterized membrane protein